MSVADEERRQIALMHAVALATSATSADIVLRVAEAFEQYLRGDKHNPPGGAVSVVVGGGGVGVGGAGDALAA